MLRDAHRLYDVLLAHHGPQGWWPADSPFEVIVGAMLMHRTTWGRVEQAIASLRRARLLDPDSLARADLRTLRRHLQPVGLHASKPRRLRGICRAIVAAGGVPELLGGPPHEARRRLLALEGVGPETADSILLYAGNRPVFVVDAYTRRVGERIGLFPSMAYDGVQRWFTRRLKHDVAVFQEYHALIVAHATRYCRARPRCADCPLQHDCDYGQAQGFSGTSASRRP